MIISELILNIKVLWENNIRCNSFWRRIE